MNDEEWSDEVAFAKLCEVAWKTCIECAKTFRVRLPAGANLGQMMDVLGVDFDCDLVGGATVKQKQALKMQLRDYMPRERMN